MNNAQPSSISQFDGYDAVAAALSRFRPGELVSTSVALNSVRRIAPACRASDEDLVALIVSIATGRTMAVRFDHRSARGTETASH